MKRVYSIAKIECSHLEHVQFDHTEPIDIGLNDQNQKIGKDQQNHLGKI